MKYLNKFNLSEKNAIVVGGAGLIGKEITIALSESGASVIVIDLNKSIKDSNLPDEVRVGAIVRKNKVMMPKSSFVFEKEDIVIILSKREQLKAVEDIFRITS